MASNTDPAVDSGSRLPDAPRTPPKASKVGSEFVSSTPAVFRFSRRDDYRPPPKANENRRNMWRDIIGGIVGPMPPSDFLSKFLVRKSQRNRPLTISSLPARKAGNAFFSNVRKDDLETETALHKAMDPCVKELLGDDYVFVDTHCKVDPETGLKLRPDASTYQASGVGASSTQNCLRLNRLPWEYKTKPSSDPFDDNAPEDQPWLFISQTNSALDTLGQLASYWTEISRRQHLTHLFLVLIVRDCARLLRFDTAGLVVSSSFSINDKDQTLAKFLWGFQQVDLEEQGVDSSVKLLDAAKVSQEIKTALNKCAFEGSDELDPDGAKPLPPDDSHFDYYEISVPSEKDSDGFRKVIVGPAFARPCSPVGRATWCYPAYDTVDRLVRLLKESWRSEDLPREWETIKKLNDKNVPYVPTFLCGGELSGQRTLTDSFVDASWNKCRQFPDKDMDEPDNLVDQVLDSRLHQRFLTKEVATPLKRFNSSKLMLQAIVHAIEAHQHAWADCAILHRDVSAKNVMFIRDDKGNFVSGFLNDWDMARSASEVEARQKERTGTLPFISIRLLRNPKLLQDVVDDLESFFWVLLYMGMRYVQTNRRKKIDKIIDDIFYNNFVEDEASVAGRKASTIQADDPILHGDFCFLERPSLTKALVHGMGTVDEYYQVARARNQYTEEKADEIMKNMNSHSYFIGSWQEYVNKSDWPAVDGRAVDYALESRSNREKNYRRRPNVGGSQSSKRKSGASQGGSSKRRKVDTARN